MKIVITLEVPDGTTVTADSIHAEQAHNAEPAYVPPFVDEFIPLPDAIPLPGDPVPFRGAATNLVPPALCPVHRVPWKQVPAGVSKKTGKPYSAFQVCSVQGCDQRPAA